MKLTIQHKIVIGHIIYWGIYILKSLVFWSENFPDLKTALINTFFLAVPVYLNYFILAPKLLYKSLKPRGFFFFSLWLIIYFGSHMLSLHGGLERFFVPGETFWNPMKGEWSMILFFNTGTFSTGSRLLADWFINQKYSRNLEIRKNEVAIQHFKSSLNPSFVNETLSILISRSLRSPKSINNQLVRLADVLRHTNYESQKNKISSFLEINVLKQYIQLQNNNFHKFQIRFIEEVFNPIDIPPNLLLRIVQEWFELSKKNLEGFCTIKLTQNNNNLNFEFPLEHLSKEGKQELKSLLNDIHKVIQGFSFSVEDDNSTINIIFKVEANKGERID